MMMMTVVVVVVVMASCGMAKVSAAVGNDGDGQWRDKRGYR